MAATRGLIRFLTALALLTVAAACDDLGPSGPRGPGSIHADLVSPNGAEGSAVLELVGGTGLGTVTATGGEVFYEREGDTLRIVVVLDVPGEIGVRIDTEDVRDLPSVTVVQVADGDNQLRSSLAGYHVELYQLEKGWVD